MKSQWRISSQNCWVRRAKNRLKAENILKHFLPPSFLFLDHSVGRQNWLGACSWLKCCRGAALRNFQHIFITKKLCIHIEFSKFWLLEYLKSAKLHPRWRILNEKGKNIGRVNCCEWMYGQKRWWLKFPVCCIDDKGKVYCRRPPQTTNLSWGAQNSTIGWSICRLSVNLEETSQVP